MDQQFIQTQKIVIEQAHHFLKSEPTEDAWWLRPAADLLLKNDVKLHEILLSKLEKFAAVEWQELRDDQGHHRDVYVLFALHLHLSAIQFCEIHRPEKWNAIDHDPVAIAMKKILAGLPMMDRTQKLWLSLCMAQCKGWVMPLLSQSWHDEMALEIKEILATPGRDGSLSLLDPDESLDHWTYRELCGLHALWHLIPHFPELPMIKRVQEIAMHHCENTQPDNTTTQPWGLPAFLWFEETRPFAEQQLHDITMSSTVSGGKRLSPLIGSILADSAVSLARAASPDVP